MISLYTIVPVLPREFEPPKIITQPLSPDVLMLGKGAVTLSISHGHNNVGTEYLLLSMLIYLRDTDPAKQTLINYGVTVDDAIREAYTLIPGRSRPLEEGEPITIPPRVTQIFAHAQERSFQRNGKEISTTDLLAGVAHEREATAAKVLIKLGVDLDRLEDDLIPSREIPASTDYPENEALARQIEDELEHRVGTRETKERARRIIKHALGGAIGEFIGKTHADPKIRRMFGGQTSADDPTTPDSEGNKS